MDALYQVVETLGKRARLLVNSTSLIVVSKLLLVRGRLAGLENISVMTYCVVAATSETHLASAVVEISVVGPP